MATPEIEATHPPVHSGHRKKKDASRPEVVKELLDKEQSWGNDAGVVGAVDAFIMSVSAGRHHILLEQHR